MKKIFIKISSLVLLLLTLITISAKPAFCRWGVLANGDMFWYEDDGTVAANGWKLIDDNNDGYAFYYYFDENGIVLRDDITPDYQVVGWDGRWVNTAGVIQHAKVDSVDSYTGDPSLYSAELMKRLNSNSAIKKGVESSGQYLHMADPSVIIGPKPSDEIVIDVNADGTAKVVLGKNVEIKKDKNNKTFDSQMDKNMQEYVAGGNKYSKKVNGTIFTKTKWKDVMALKGNEATILFDNPSNNFNKLKGRIATHYFTYSDRTTTCTLNIYNEDKNDLIYTTSDFNYNGGVNFECTFPRKTKKIKFELEVDGQYPSRICYLRKCEYGFDKAAYEEELYDDETEAEYLKKVGTDSEADEEYEEEDDGIGASGEIPIEGESPDARWRRLHNISDDDYWASFGYDEDEMDLTDAMKASISEARKRAAEADEKRNSVSGPAFDPKLKDLKEAVGPDGSSRVIPVGQGSDEKD